jgi:hypothetical protein
VRNRQDLVVIVAFVDQTKDTQGARLDHATGEGGFVRHDDDIEGVAIGMERPWHRATVSGIVQ